MQYESIGSALWWLTGSGANSVAVVPLVPTVLADATDSTDLAAYLTASITPLANQPLLAAVTHLRAAGSIASSTCSGNGLTWTQVATSAISTTRRLSVFWAAGIASPSAGAVTFDLAAQVQDSANWVVLQFAGADIASPVVQFKTITPAAGTTFTNTFDTTIGVTSAHVSFVMTRDISLQVTPDATFTELADRTSGGSTTRLETAWAINRSAVTPTWTNSDSFASISVEVKAA